jgi:HAMP domain-containing protein/HPt (histidine-containing phosphotransfer) domain-containing protein
MDAVKFISIRNKLITLMLRLLLGLVGAIILVIVIFGFISIRLSFRQIEHRTLLDLVRKGSGLVNNSSLALQDLVEGNAFAQMRSLVHETVSKDQDIVYGILINKKREVLARVLQQDTCAEIDRLEVLNDTISKWAVGLTNASHCIMPADSGDIIEFAAPVFVDGSSYATIRYGFSMKSMHREIKLARKQLLFTIVWTIILIAVISTIMILIVSRTTRQQANALITPLEKLTRAAHEIAARDYSEPIAIASNDEVGLLAEKFDTMRTTIKEYTEHLEDKVALRTRELVASQKNVQDIMRAIDEGIFTVNADLTINSEHSKTAEKIFGVTEFDKQDIAALLALDEKTRLFFAKWMAMVFKQPNSPAVWRLCPVKDVVIEHDTRMYLSIDFQPIYENNVLSRIMVIANDITQRKKIEQHLARLNAEKELQMERVLAIVNGDTENVPSILDLGRSIIRTFEAHGLQACQGNEAVLSELCRDLHTLKGNSGSMGFSTLSKLCDDCESAVHDYREHCGKPGPDDTTRINRAFAGLKVEAQAVDDLQSKLFSGKENRLSIDRIEYAAMLEDLTAGTLRTAPEFSRRMRLLAAVKFADFCSEFSTMVADYCTRFSKNILPLRIDSPDVKIGRKTCKALKGPVTHLIRNALDHGIEDDAARRAAGKGPGLISMAIRATDAAVEVEIADDGRGIDPGHIAASAIRKGFISAALAEGLTDAQKLELVFLHGFSTREDTTEISGRGVGMDAVKADIEKAGGGVRLVSRVGLGTVMVVWVPRSFE